MGNTVPPRAPRREATGTGRRCARTGGSRRSENVFVTEVVAPPATPSRRVVATARKQGSDGDDGDVEEEETARAGRPRAGRALRAGGADGAAPALRAGKVLTVKVVMTRKDAEALAARLKARSARERKARMAELEGELRAGSCGGGGGASRDAQRPMLPPIKESRFERITPVV